MNKSIQIIGIALAVLLIGIGVYTSKRDTSAEVIRIGAIVPLTGQYAALGESVRNAMIMAKDDLGEDANIEIIFEDDAYDPKLAVTAYKKLRDIDDIDAVVVLGAPSIQAVSSLTNADAIPLLALGGTLVYEKDTVFQLMPSSNLLFPVLGEIYGKKYKNIAIAHSNATLFADNTKAFISGLPDDVRYEEFVLTPDSDYRTEVQKIVRMNPDATTVFLPQGDALAFLQVLRVQDREGKIKIVCDFGTEIAPDEYANAIGSDRLDGCVSTNVAQTSTDGFLKEYSERFNSAPQITADFSYDAVMIVNELAKSTPKSDWVNTLAADDFEFDGYASGRMQFNDDGTRLDLPPEVHVYENGKFVPLEE
jgi:ABC-type branched-subunit amino acid transport system substrate-binding protein